jgi:hypothetical protein
MEHTHHTTTHGSGSEAALRWLTRQLQWERLLSELRTPVHDDDEAGPTRR